MTGSKFQDIKSVCGSKTCVLYVLSHKTEPRIKIGITGDPGMRLKSLPEVLGGQINFDCSLCLICPSIERAREIEVALHKVFAPFNVVPNHRRSGWTEWFDCKVMSTLVQMLHLIKI